MQTSAERSATGCVRVVEPALGRSELRWVLIAAMVTVVLSALAVAWQRHHLQSHELAAYQLDLATDLKPAEQGIYTDLQAIYDEWAAVGAALPPPAPEVWVAEGWPPFADAQANTNRVARNWTLTQVAGRWAYVGAAAVHNAPEHARAVAWVLPAVDADGDGVGMRFEVWLSPAAPQQQSLPARLDAPALAAAGWGQVTAHARDAAGVRGTADPHAGHGH